MDAAIAMRLLVGASVLLAFAGLIVAFVARNALKRLIGATMACIGAAAVGGASGFVALTWTMLAVAIAALSLGALILARIHEVYGSVEIADIAAADRAED